MSAERSTPSVPHEKVDPWEAHFDQAEAYYCPECATRTWTRNRHVFKCRICERLWQITDQGLREKR